MVEQEEILTMRDVAKLLRVSVNTLHQIQRSGDPIKCFRVGASVKNKRYRFYKTDVVHYIEKHQNHQRQEA